MNEIAPGQCASQRQNQDHRGSDFTKPQPIYQPRLPISKNREIILEQIAHKWAARGFYQSPTRAMIALLEGV